MPQRGAVAKAAPRLRLLGLVFVLYFTVSGGAFTLEALVADVGPVLALAALVAIPVLWAVPEALLIGELASIDRKSVV